MRGTSIPLEVAGGEAERRLRAGGGEGECWPLRDLDLKEHGQAVAVNQASSQSMTLTVCVLS